MQARCNKPNNFVGARVLQTLIYDHREMSAQVRDESLGLLLLPKPPAIVPNAIGADVLQTCGFKHMLQHAVLDELAGRPPELCAVLDSVPGCL